MSAARVAMPGDKIIVHEGIYRERIAPPRGGTSDRARITYQAATLAKGGIVEMRLGRPDGEYLGSAMVTNTGDWENFAVFPLKMLRPLSGKQNVCLITREPAKKLNGSTTIWAQFPDGVDPNQAAVEVAVRPQVFYPEQPGIDYITVRGFTLQNAATNWAPPSAEQPGLIGTRWSKGWVIENNVIRNSRCSGIALGRSTFGHSHHYQTLPPRVYAEKNGGQTVAQLENYFENASWDKDETGFHVVRNNHIYDCGQTGIVGCSGAAFSLIEHNEIHDICIDETFTGEEMAGIKLHFAIDAVLRHNHIYRTIRGMWLDWGPQGIQVVGNLFHDNDKCEDLFMEVCHGPALVANNIFLSKNALNLSSQGIACVHNLINGRISGGRDRCAGGRLTYVYQPHSTTATGKVANPGGDLQCLNNLITSDADFNHLDEPGLPIRCRGDVSARAGGFDPRVKLVEKADGWNLTMNVAETWKNAEKRTLVKTSTLEQAQIPHQAFTNPDGTPFKIDYDFLGNKRKASNPYPGPFELKRAGTLEWKVWPKK